jgi:hypothetical protein
MQSQSFTPVIPVIGGQLQTLFPAGQARMLQDVFELQAFALPQIQIQVNVPPATVSGTLVFTQLAPAAVWTINHNTGQFPSVTTVDATGGEIKGTVQYMNSNQVTVTFSAPIAGRAFLNM